MCGRYFLNDEDDEIAEMLHELEGLQEGIKTGEIFPTNVVPILRSSGNMREAAALKWGFPRWNGGGVVINARTETALEKNMFRKSLLEHRCVIPSSGFFEWQRAEGSKRKDKYHLSMPGSDTLYMAGAWNSFKSPEGDYEAFVILTTDSNDSMCPPNPEISLFNEEPRPIHDRMPVILQGGELDDWLTDGDFRDIVLRRTGPELSLELVET